MTIKLETMLHELPLFTDLLNRFDYIKQIIQKNIDEYNPHWLLANDFSIKAYIQCLTDLNELTIKEQNSVLAEYAICFDRIHKTHVELQEKEFREHQRQQNIRNEIC